METYLLVLSISLQSSTINSSSDSNGSDRASHDPSADGLSLRCGHGIRGRDDKLERYVWLKQWDAVCGRRGVRWKKCRSFGGRAPFAKADSPRESSTRSPLFLLDNKQHNSPPRQRIQHCSFEYPATTLTESTPASICRTTQGPAPHASAACLPRSPASSRTSKRNWRN